MNKFKVLIIDDESSIRKFLTVNFENSGYQVIEAETGHEGVALAASHHPHLIILDMGLPDQSGMEVLKALRAWYKAPILVLTVQDGDHEKVAALDSGADDYITKPFSLPELLARVRVAMRHNASETPGVPLIQNGPLEVDRAAHTVRVQGIPVKLTATEYEILLLLAQNIGKVVTQRTILNSVWGPNSVEHHHYLRVYFGQIRKKLKVSDTVPEMIETESGVGYRLRNLSEA